MKHLEPVAGNLSEDPSCQCLNCGNEFENSDKHPSREKKIDSKKSREYLSLDDELAKQRMVDKFFGKITL